VTPTVPPKAGGTPPPMGGGRRALGVVGQVEGLRERLSEAGRQVEGPFESVLAHSFDGEGWMRN
jgi:hypothetical protein